MMHEIRKDHGLWFVITEAWPNRAIAVCTCEADANLICKTLNDAEMAATEMEEA